MRFRVFAAVEAYINLLLALVRRVLERGTFGALYELLFGLVDLNYAFFTNHKALIDQFVGYFRRVRLEDDWSFAASNFFFEDLDGDFSVLNIRVERSEFIF